jgi:hypothetical protein
VQVNFWFFLFVYYGFYNVTALIWVTKLFNLYRLNWFVGSSPRLFDDNLPLSPRKKERH